MKKSILLLVLGMAIAIQVQANEQASVTYLGNEGLLLNDGENKVLFDPFFHNVYGQYQAVPPEIQEAIASNTPPYNDIDLIVISHAHGDHFTADTVADYLTANKKTMLVAPTQATEKILQHKQDLNGQIKGIDLDYGDVPIELEIGNITVQSVRIPHAGWPDRKDISNLVHRVSFASGASIIHMGDADPRDQHFAPYAHYFKQQEVDAAFPPYWFFISSEGPTILQSRINAKESIGIHVPVIVPEELIQSGGQYFSKPGTIKILAADIDNKAHTGQ